MMKKLVIVGAVLVAALTNVQAGGKPLSTDQLIARMHSIEYHCAQMIYTADEKCRAGMWTADQCVNFKKQVYQQEIADLTAIKNELERRRGKHTPDAHDKLLDQLGQ